MKTKNTPPPVSTALGISVGDTVRTSYGTGGVITKVTRPHYVDEYCLFRGIRTWLTVSITYKDGDKYNGTCYINDIRREGDQWFTDANDEIYITKAHKHGSPSQLALFEVVLEPELPYAFRDGVDYSKNAWSCDWCGDFNAEPESGDMRWHCPTCERYGVYRLYVMPPREPNKKQANLFQAHLDE